MSQALVDELNEKFMEKIDERVQAAVRVSIPQPFGMLGAFLLAVGGPLAEARANRAAASMRPAGFGLSSKMAVAASERRLLFFRLGGLGGIEPKELLGAVTDRQLRELRFDSKRRALTAAFDVGTVLGLEVSTANRPHAERLVETVRARGVKSGSPDE